MVLSLWCKPPLVIDGGLGSELRARGHVFSGSRWSASLLEDSKGLEALRDVHFSFFEAGANVATTSSYALGASGEDLELCGRSVSCVRDAIAVCDGSDATGGNRRRLVMGSLGAFGATLPGAQEFSGTYVDEPRARETVTNHHAKKALALVAAGADCLVLETVPRAEEAHWFADWLRSSGSGIGVPVAFSFTVKSADPSGKARENDAGGGGSGIVTAGGGDFSSAAAGVAERVPVSQLMAVGVNCCDPRIVPGALSVIPETVPRIAYANSGEGWDAERSEWINETALSIDAYAEAAAGWVRDHGAIAVGGCCRIGPDHIRALRTAIDKIEA